MRIQNSVLFLQGELNKYSVPLLQKKFSKMGSKVFSKIDVSDVRFIDSAGVSFLDILQEKTSAKLINIPTEILPALETFTSTQLKKLDKPKPDHFFVQIGDFLLQGWSSFIDLLYLTADISFWSFIGIFNTKGQRKGSVTQQSILIGADATGIIGLLSFILGLILALQSAAQLRQFGANIFVADLIAISMVREMGPMMTAIIIAGRSGSSIASEIATMQVTEEIDALRMMAINPIRYIVVPKFNAITFCMPLLVTLSTIIGIAGGLVVGITYLDLSVISFMTEVIKVLTLKDILIGLSKSVVFAWVIVIIGSYYGFHVKGGAEGVGKVTTLSVVASIFAVIVLDAMFSLIYLGG